MTAGRHQKVGAEPTGETDLIELVTSAFTLAPGHQARGNRCVICAETIGGRPVRIITVLSTQPTGCPCGELDGMAYLACAGHKGDDEISLTTRLIDYRDRAHPWPRRP